MMIVKNNKLFVDTSGWAIYANQLDPLHAQIITMVRRARKKNALVTTNYVLTELVPLLSNRLRISRSQVMSIIRLIKDIPNLQIIHIDEATDKAAWDILDRYTDTA